MPSNSVLRARKAVDAALFGKDSIFGRFIVLRNALGCCGAMVTNHRTGVQELSCLTDCTMSQYRTWIRIKSRKVPQQHVMGAGSPSKPFTRDVLIEQQDAHRHQQLQSTNNPTEANVLNSATESAEALGYNRRANAPISRPPVICQLRPSLHRVSASRRAEPAVVFIERVDDVPHARDPLVHPMKARTKLFQDCFVASAIWFQVDWLRSAFVRLNPIALCAANSNSNPTAQDEP
jgi:hypothetical protein